MRAKNVTTAFLILLILTIFFSMSAAAQDASSYQAGANEVIPAPNITPASGSYPNIVEINMPLADGKDRLESEYEIRFTTDGSTPTKTEGTLCYGVFYISFNTTIKAVQYKIEDPSNAVSAVTTREYTIYKEAIPVPSITPDSGIYAQEQTITLSGLPDYSIRYTTNGVSPTEKYGTVYKGPFTISSSMTVKAIQYKTYIGSTVYKSDVITREYMINATEPLAPSISPSDGTYDGVCPVTMTAGSGCSILYTLDGTEPTEANGIKYTGTLYLYDSATLKAVQCKSYGSLLLLGPVATREYTINKEDIPAPVISADETTYVNAQQVTITGNEGCLILYTLDGKDPTYRTGIKYNAPFMVRQDTTVKAMQFKNCNGVDLPGAMASKALTIKYEYLNFIHAGSYSLTPSFTQNVKEYELSIPEGTPSVPLTFNVPDGMSLSLQIAGSTGVYQPQSGIVFNLPIETSPTVVQLTSTNGVQSAVYSLTIHSVPVNVPATGDTAPLGLYALLLVGCASGLWFLLKTRKKEKHNS